MEPGFTLFDTAIGRCGIAWGERGVLAVQLPERNELATRTRLLRRCADGREMSPPPEIARTIDAIIALLNGEPSDLSAVTLDLNRIEPFERQVYEIARTVGPGATITYGEIATRATSERRWGAILSRWSCRAIVFWRQVAKSAAFPPMAASPPSCGSSRSRAPAPARSRHCLTVTAHSAWRSSRGGAVRAKHGPGDAVASPARTIHILGAEGH
jgi:methylated-DNA-[protein]-cysteine S-methyltransferase